MHGLSASLSKYVDLKNAIAFQRDQWDLQSTQVASAATTSPSASIQKPEVAFKELIDSVTREVELHGGFGNPLNSIPISLLMQLQAAEKWLCPVLGRGFALYLGEAFGSEVLYGDGDDGVVIVTDIDQWRLNERVRHFAAKFHGRVRVELRMLTVPSDSAFDIESAFEELFTKCVVAPLVEDMANIASKQ